MPLATLTSIGSKGDDISLLQSRLASQGFDPGPVDGDFGLLTDAAVRRFQQAKGLLVDGVVGPETSAALQGTTNVSSLAMTGTIVELGLAAERFGLSVGECSAPGAPARWGPVHSGHSENSFHFRGRAFDAAGSADDMRRFAAFVAENFASGVAELIHNPNGSIKDGSAVDPVSFWGDATWAGHVDHVHLAI